MKNKRIYSAAKRLIGSPRRGAGRPFGPSQVIATVNGPGEISSWLFPFVRTLKQKAPHFRVCAVVLRSVFKSGAETDVLKTIPEIDAVSSVKDTSRLIYRGEFPQGFLRDVPGTVIHFGGEPLLSKLLAARFKYPLLFYGEGSPARPARYERIFLSAEWPETAVDRVFSPNGNAGKKRDNHKIKEVGNLMIDAALMRCPRRKSPEPGSLTIGLFPGSRFYQVQQLVPFFLKVARLAAPGLEKQYNNIYWTAAKADYISTDTLRAAAAEEEGRILDGDSGDLEKGESFGRLVSRHGVEIEILRPEEVMSGADVVITVPGTNTAELAVLGVPMLVLLPSQSAERYPMPGLAGHLHRIPLVGGYIKYFLLWLFWRSVKYVAYPNRKEKREIVPEIVGKITPAGIAGRLVEYVKRPFEPISKELKAAMGTPGAAVRLVEEVLDFLYNN